jgi:hypothetical protein
MLGTPVLSAFTNTGRQYIPRGDYRDGKSLIPRLYLISCPIYLSWTSSVNRFAFATGLLEPALSALPRAD